MDSWGLVDNSGLLVSGVVVILSTRGHSPSGISSSGVTGKLLVLEAIEAALDSGGRRLNGESLF
jgi:hypothetical protein